jgi:hypothetical protein
MGEGLEIGVIGDFSGRDGAPELEARLAEKVLIPVDLDEFDACLRRVGPELELGLPFARRVRIERFEDFEPDVLIAALPALSLAPEAHDRLEPPSPDRAAAEGRSVLDDLLDTGRERGALAPLDPAGRAIQEIIERSGDGIDHDAEARRRATSDALTAERLRLLLHHPRWQGVEARWRSLHAFAREAVGVDGARLRLLDLGPADLAGDLTRAGGHFEDTTVHRLLVERERGTPGGVRFDLLVVDVELGAGENAEALAALLGALSERAQCPVLATAAPSLSGVTTERVEPPRRESLGALAARVGKGRLGVVAPRVLVRAPYEAGEFGGLPMGELESDAAEPGLLWGSGAWIVARAALAAVEAGLPASALGRFGRVPGLPMAVLGAGGAATQVGPAERTLSERELSSLADAGLVPIAGIRGSDDVQIVALPALGGGTLLSRS